MYMILLIHLYGGTFSVETDFYEEEAEGRGEDNQVQPQYRYNNKDQQCT